MNAYIQLGEIARIAEMIAPLCDGDEQLLADMMEGETDLVSLVTRLHEQVARDGEMLAGITERAAAIRERKGRIEARQAAFKAGIGKLLRAAKLSKLELPEVTYSVRDGKPKLEILLPGAVPDEWCKPRYEPDKTAINLAFADADSLPNWLAREPATDVVTARMK
jgi:hypothetical protein